MSKTDDHKLIMSKFVSDGTLKKTLEKTDPIINWLLNLDRVNDLYQALRKENVNVNEFADDVLKVMNIKLDVKNPERIPKDGRIITVSNHPFGAIDGIILITILRQIRENFRIMATEMLGHIPELKDHFILVDNFKRGNSRNLKPLRDSLSWLKNDGLLSMFPAGVVSHYTFERNKVADSEWSTQVAKIARKTKSDILPVYFNGRNSTWFQIAGVMHSAFRTMMLPRELMKKQQSTIEVVIGKPIPFNELEKFEHDRELTDYVRFKTYQLSDEHLTPDSILFKNEPVIDRVDRELLKNEISTLPEDQLLSTYKSLNIYFADFDQIPNVMREMGRLREVTFRGVGEGTGTPIDVDDYDQWYKHLFVWDTEADEIMGAYRLGLSDDILDNLGMKGLYSTTLFKYKKKFITNKPPAIELGRSFIQLEYQKKHYALMLLWRGISAFLLKHPKYRILFGPVSISKDYHEYSKTAITEMLGEHMTSEVRPRAAFKSKADKEFLEFCSKFKNPTLDELSKVVQGIEDDGKDIPILLKHYLRLGAKILAFNVDKDFNDVIDGLIFLDLLDVPERLLKQYMGDEGAIQYRKFHLKTVTFSDDDE